MTTYRIFIGRDPRQPVAASVLAQSLYMHASAALAVTMLDMRWLPIRRCGLTTFTFTRYLVPWMCHYEGWALFLDADMLARADVTKLWDLRESRYDVMLVKNRIRCEWPSLMMFNCENCHRLTPEWVEDEKNQPAALQWAKEIGELPTEWNHAIGYDPRNSDAKMAHFTQGVPVWKETKGSEFAEEWWAVARQMASSVEHHELMGRSVHVQPQMDQFRSHNVATGEDIAR